MTNEEILKKAIEKAIKNGLDIVLFAYDIGDLCKEALLNNLFKYTNSIIFSHDFAKAFWGERKICPDCGISETFYSTFTEHGHCKICSKIDTKFVVNWKYYLQKLVLQEEPLQYLKKFL